MSQPLISVVITAYNYGRFVQECIESLLSQDYPAERLEIVVVDDGSTDDTAEQVKKYGSRIRYFRQQNGGQARALNLGFANAKGEIIALLDADDYWFPGKARRIAEEFQKNPNLGMVYHPFLEFDAETGEKRKPHFRAVSGRYFGGEPEFFWYQSPGTSAAFRRQPLQAMLPIPEKIRMLADGYVDVLLPFYSTVLAIPEYLAAYRLHGNNCFYADDRQMPSEVRRSRLHQWQVLIDAIREALVEKGFSPRQLPVRSLLDRLTLRQEKDEFLLQPPGRVRFFHHLLLYNRCYGPHISRRLRLINYVNAFGALATGHKRFRLLDQWRERVFDSVRLLRAKK